MRKLFYTLRMLTLLFLARTFGEYQHSGWNGYCDFAIYRYRGHTYLFPTDHCY